MLLDTHVVLWLLEDSPRFGSQAREAITRAPRVYFSAASLWELRIKEALGKVTVPRQLSQRLLSSGLAELPVTSAHTEALATVTTPHRDPFDRMLLAQGHAEGLRLVTADAVLLGLDHPVLDARV